MIDSVLTSSLREQAGANSFNRFDYQAHWIVYHMIKEYKKGLEFLIICEFHDDMAKSSSISNPKCVEFYQIKTTETFKTWTLDRLCKTTKKKSGTEKHSFLGFIFYNFMTFKTECSICHFVSNIEKGENISTWQAIIEDGKELKVENNPLYCEIKEKLRKEYMFIAIHLFEEIFDRFIQNTYVYYGDLTLDNYEKVVAGEFFQMLDNTEIFTSNSNKILRDIIEEVRKKSKRKVSTPISYKSLQEQKGISSEIFKKLKEQMNNIPKSAETYNEIDKLLISHNFSVQRRRTIIRKLKKHHIKMLDITDSLYNDNLGKIILIIDNVIDNNFENIEDISLLKNEVITKCRLITKNYEEITDILVEALVYERIVS